MASTSYSSKKGDAAAAKKQAKQKAARIVCSAGSKCKKAAAARCSHTMCKSCCMMMWPAVCEYHGLPGPKEPLDKYFNEEGEDQPTPDGASPPTKRKKENISAGKSQTFGSKEGFQAFIRNFDLCGKTEEIRFGGNGNYGIRDEDIVNVARNCPKLTQLSLGDSDTGDGTWLTDASIYYLANKCPRLTKIRLESCTSITDHAIIEVFEKCAGLQEIVVTGHDKSHGKITGVCLIPLLRDKNKAKQLSRVGFYSQMLEQAVMTKFRKQRKRVRLGNGDMGGSSMASQMISGMTGGDWFDDDEYFF